MRRWWFGVFVAVAAALALAAVWQPGSGRAAPKDDFKVGFIYIGVPGDFGWDRQQDLARQYVQKHVSGVQTIRLESVAEANAGAAIDQLVSQGAKMIFATSFGYGPAVIQAARRYPNVIFEHATGYQRAKNVGTYYLDHWEASYLQGVIAGKMTRSNVLGYVGSFPTSEVVRDIDAYALGAQSVNPKATVKVVLISSWFDPPKETQAARSLIDAGADVLFGIEDDAAVLEEAARHHGVYASTWNSNMVRFGPKAFLSADVLHWGPFYAREVKAAMNGTWKSKDVWGTLSDGMLQMAPYGRSVPLSVRALVTRKLNGFKKGTFNPFVGPIRDQKGKLRVPAGKKMSFGQIVGWSWFVQGVIGKA